MADAGRAVIEVRVLVKTPRALRALNEIVEVLEDLEEDLHWRKDDIQRALRAAKRLLHVRVRGGG